MKLTPRLAILLTVLVFSAGALALEPFTLGNVFKLGTSTTASLPTSSATIESGIIYNTDTDKVMFNNGSAWANISESAETYWRDAGAGYIFEPESVKNPDGGGYALRLVGPATSTGIITPTLIINTLANSGTDNASIEFWDQNGAIRLGAIYGQASDGAPPAGRGLNFVATYVGGGTEGHTFGGGGATGIPPTFNRWAQITANGSTGGLLTMSGNSGRDSIRLVTGARDHIGSGTNDYWVSDGTGIETPSYIEAADYMQGATGFCSGTACTGTAFAAFPAAGGAQTSRALYDSTNSVWRVSNGTDWLPQLRLQFSGLCRGAASEECGDAQAFGIAKAETGKNYAGSISCAWLTPGTGIAADGGTGKVVIRAVSAINGVDCRCDLGACAGAAGTPFSCSCGTFFTPGAVLLQNLQATLDGGIFGECDTHPGSIYCTVD